MASVAGPTEMVARGAVTRGFGDGSDVDGDDTAGEGSAE